MMRIASSMRWWGSRRAGRDSLVLTAKGRRVRGRSSETAVAAGGSASEASRDDGDERGARGAMRGRPAGASRRRSRERSLEGEAMAMALCMMVSWLVALRRC
ncbi:hypothetical protein CS062_14735 [Roseateles chitinivorans]|uniref:Uncharacterized protein n=1 Tax=Roseateles chitinivorans TaxID=2917965 RepID=A0A2G9C7P0_9BURK|nr:hypothetical protein CS062_14735 [Roseateles chitinivorans]